MFGSTTRILIVEDDALLALHIEGIVEDLGYWVVGPMHNLNDGLDHAKRDDIDFALLDFDLGNGTDAIPIAEALTDRGVPFAFTSGTDPAIIHSSLPDAEVIGKPLSEEEIERVLP